jgi:diguanylate cyclase (GGDEF)-like protein/PAS domain S-box-containing protein
MNHYKATSDHISEFASRAAMRVANDVTENPTHYQQVLQELPIAVYITDADGRITFFNNAAVEMAGRTPRLGIDKWCVTWKLLRTDGTPLPHHECPMAVAIKNNRAVRGQEAIAERPDGTRVPFIPFPTPLRDSSGKLIGALNILLEISDRKEFEQKLAYLAHHDFLTGLPNRAVFSARLYRSIETAKTTATNFAVACIDLDGFKDINDTFGHAVGDEVLKNVAARLQNTTQNFFVARIGGDAFIMIFPNVTEADVTKELDALQMSVRTEMIIAGHAIRMEFSAGVAMFPSAGADEIAIVAAADAALQHAKRDKAQTIRFFDAEIEKRIRYRACIQRDLRSTIERNALNLHYQPLATSQGKIIGFEALVRWYHPTKGNISPDAFVPISEECGLILPLSRWVLRQACLEAASWKRPLSVAVNLSPVQFQHENLPVLIETVLSEVGLAPERLELEITEGVLIADSNRALATLTKLKKLGVQIALDDFGTGHSSLSYLRDFPFSKIKIDRSFIAKIGIQESAHAIIHAVIGLGHSMKMSVTAEGVETREQFEYLRDEDCDLMQGYLIGRPGFIESFSALTGKTGKRLTSMYGPDGKLKKASLPELGFNFVL